MEEKPATMVRTSIRISAPAWRLLRDLAESRSLVKGGRASVSGVVDELVMEAAAREPKADRRRP